VTSSVRIHITGAAIVIVVMVSAIAAVYAKHESRKSFMELQALIAERDRLGVEWGRLQIEQGTWSTYARVEQVAREKMRMRSPEPGQTVLLSKVDPQK
jgi:cell division protein FtsL